MTVWHFLLHVGGIDNLSGRWYGFWSGFGSDLPLFGALAMWAKHKNCHEPWCWRIGHHPDPVEPSFRRCSKHHLEAKGAA